MLYDFDGDEVETILELNKINFDEFADLIDEAARMSRYAAKAYTLLRDIRPDLETLEARQRMIAGRMKDAA